VNVVSSAILLHANAAIIAAFQHVVKPAIIAAFACNHIAHETTSSNHGIKLVETCTKI